MKKTIINVFLIITAIIIYYLQSNFFMWFNIAGIKPNLFVILALFIGLFTNRTMGIAYGVGIGIAIDILIGHVIGIYAVSLGIIGLLAALLDKNFSKDSRITIILMVAGATIIFEIIYYLLNYMILGINVEIINFIFMLLIEVIYNIILTIILYPLIQKFGYYIENEYKGNKILTRYF